MSEPNELPDRERLASDPELGEVLRRANVEYRANLDESAAFRRVGERLAEAARPGQRRHGVAALGLVCAAAAGWLVWLQAGRVGAPEVLLGPEVSVGGRSPVGAEPAHVSPQGHASPESDVEAREPAREAPVPSAPIAQHARDSWAEPARDDTSRSTRAAVSGETLDTARLTADERRRGSETVTLDAPELETDARARLRAPLERQPTSRRPPKQTEPPRATPAPGSGAGGLSEDRAPGRAKKREDCLELARSGDPRAAERCFDQRAAGSGLGAEMALYEMARLRRDVLRDAIGALEALSAYRDRFERGSLRNEVDLSRVELLAELGRSTDALRESAAMLAGGSGRERAAELHLLRGDVYRRDVRDLRAAAAEYAQAEALGGTRGAEASRRLGACLEGLGDGPGALAAYRRYVADPSRPHVAEVSRRIERLAGSSVKPGSSR
jgi:hypothetical protein